MVQRTFNQMYDNYSDAQAVVNELEAAGISHNDINLVANADAHGRASTSTTESTAAGSGAVAGTVVGGGAGLLAGIGALAIPGIGPIVAAGWLVATLTGAGVGAGAGGLVGALTGSGVHRDEANVYSEGVKRGGSLVTVRADDSQAAAIETILNRRATTDWQARRASYGSDWRGVDETAGSATVPPNLSDTAAVPPVDPTRRS